MDASGIESIPECEHAPGSAVEGYPAIFQIVSRKGGGGSSAVFSSTLKRAAIENAGWWKDRISAKTSARYGSIRNTAPPRSSVVHPFIAPTGRCACLHNSLVLGAAGPGIRQAIHAWVPSRSPDPPSRCRSAGGLFGIPEEGCCTAGNCGKGSLLRRCVGRGRRTVNRRCHSPALEGGGIPAACRVCTRPPLSPLAPECGTNPVLWRADPNTHGAMADLNRRPGLEHAAGSYPAPSDPDSNVPTDTRSDNLFRAEKVHAPPWTS